MLLVVGIPGQRVVLPTHAPDTDPVGHHFADIPFGHGERAQGRLLAFGIKEPVLPVVAVSFLVGVAGPVEVRAGVVGD
jgi:hypothetical protein